MTPIRKQRLFLASMVVLAGSVAGTLLTLALQENMTYLHTPSEVVSGIVPPNAVFRLGGVVREGSVRREAGTLKIEFKVTDRVEEYRVRFEGILPDLFREGQSVISRGRIKNGAFQAEEVLAKHDETYMPPEVAEKIAQAQARKPGIGNRESGLEKPGFGIRDSGFEEAKQEPDDAAAPGSSESRFPNPESRL